MPCAPPLGILVPIMISLAMPFDLGSPTFPLPALLTPCHLTAPQLLFSPILDFGSWLHVLVVFPMVDKTGG